MNINNRFKNLFATALGLVVLLAAYNVYAYDAEFDPNSDKGEGATVKLSGTFDFRSAFRNQNHLSGSDKKVSANKKNFAFNTQAAIFAEAKYRYNEVDYGLRITLVPTAKTTGSPSYNGSHIYIAPDDIGKVEIGSSFAASDSMRITACEIGAAVCDGWGTFAKLDGSYMQFQSLSPEFASGQDYFLGDSLESNLHQINDGTEQSRKVTFYTPVMQGFQVGVSYIPDSANVGIGKFDKDNAPDPLELGDKHTLLINNHVRDAFGAAISYERNISDGVDFKVALTGEYGKPANKAVEKVEENVVNTYKLSTLRSYNVGAFLNYGSFSYAASYGNLGKSLTNKEINKTGRQTFYYDAAVAYKQGPIKASLTYFASSKYKNKVDSFTLGTEYAAAPGLTPYAEITYFQAKGRPSFYPDADKKKIKGTVALIGAKLKF